jgi:hypothetical protein
MSRPVLAAYALATITAAGIGWESKYLEPLLIGLVTLLPIFAHVRHVGLRRAIAEPTPITLIVAFYLFVFPLRGLVIAASGYRDILFVHRAVTGRDLTEVLFMASAGTTVLVETYYAVVKRSVAPLNAQELRSLAVPSSRQVILLAKVLAFLSLAGLLGVLVRYGGISGAQAALLSHTKGPLTSNTNATDSAWQLFAGPAVWCASYIAVNRATPSRIRAVFAGVTVIILTAMLTVYGSRLNVILGLTGAWIVYHYAGGRVRVSVVLLMVPLFALLSVVVLSSRTGGLNGHVSAVERYSRIAGYGALDVSLAVRQQPDAIRMQLSKPNRWLDLPGYLVPSALWHGRPNIGKQRLDLFVARAVGTVNDQNTGFPPTYLTEDWLLGGWPLLLVLSAAGGAALGWVVRKLVADAKSLTPGKLLAYCYIVSSAFSYYKDGDLLTSAVGDVRTGIYLAILLYVTGVWSVGSSGVAIGVQERLAR